MEVVERDFDTVDDHVMDRVRGRLWGDGVMGGRDGVAGGQTHRIGEDGGDRAVWI